MTKGILLFFSLLFFIPKPGTLNGKWKFVQYIDTHTGLVTKEPSDFVDKEYLTLVFADNDTVGKITGRAVVNRVYSNYSLRPGNSIVIDPLGGTKVGERYEWVDTFREKIKWVSRYEIRNDTMFFYGKDTQCMVFVKRE